MDKEIPEHYHCGIIDEDDNLKEFSVSMDNGDWCVFDDWGEISEERIIYRNKDKNKTLKECYRLLNKYFKVKSVIQGAGCPNEFLSSHSSCSK